MQGGDQKETHETYTRRLATIVAADLCNYGILSEQDQATAIKLVDLLYGVFEQITLNNGGRVFKRVADGFLAEFPSTHSAMNGAVEFCIEMQNRRNLSPTSVETQMRIGVHVGDVVYRDDGDILGHSVNIAVRLQEQAEPGTILISSNVFNLLGKDIVVQSKKRGKLNLKHISHPVIAYEVNPSRIATPNFISKIRAVAFRPLMSGAVMILLMFAVLHTHTKRQNRNFEQAIDTIVQNNYSQEPDRDVNISSDYIRTVLDSLHRSKIPSHQASFALLEAGNIGQAVGQLERSLENMGFGSEAYINTMHQIAALSYYHDSAKAIAYYETLLELDPTDVTALVALVKGYQIRLEADKAFELYQSIIKNNIGTPYEQLRVQVDMAFSHMLQLEFPIALTLLKRIESDIVALGDHRLYIEWQFLYGYGSVRTGELEIGETLLLATVSELKKIGADANLPRAHNALGQLHEIRASKANAQGDTALHVEHLRGALKHYQKQYEAGLQINKKRELPEALYAMGEMYFELEDYDQARQKFLEALRVARSENYITSERRARMGLARLSQRAGDQANVCRQVTKIKILYRKSTVKLNEKSLATLEGLGCGFKRDDI